MKKTSNNQLRNEIIGLGKNSVRKNYYRSLLEKNKALEKEIQLRKDAEDKLKILNEELENRITERTKTLETTNEKLRNALDELEKSYSVLLEVEKLSSLSHLVIGISHELNTPIGNSLMTSTYLKKLLQDYRSKYQNTCHTEINKFEQGLDMLIKSIENSVKLVENFKKISDMHEIKQVMKFYIKDVIEPVSNSLKNEYANFSNVTLSYDSSEQHIIHGDYSLFGQLLTILMNNSMIHAFNEDGGCIKIDIKENNHSYIMTYVDDGKGFEDHVSKHAFEPFYTTARSSKSSGLGLFTAYNLIKRVNGKIILTSNGRGSSFEILIPKQV